MTLTPGPQNRTLKHIHGSKKAHFLPHHSIVIEFKAVALINFESQCMFATHITDAIFFLITHQLFPSLARRSFDNSLQRGG